MSDFYGLNLKSIFERAHIGIIIHRWDTTIVYANPNALSLFELSFEQIISKDSYDSKWNFLDSSGKKLLIADYPINKVKASQKPLVNEIVGFKDINKGTVHWLMVNAFPEGDVDCENRSIVVTFNDITDFKQLYFFSDIVENTQDIVIVCEANNITYPTGPKIVYVNPAFESLTGYKKEDALGETPRILQGELTDKKAMSRIKTALENKEPITETLLNYDINGRPYWIEMNIIPLKNKYGEVTHFGAIERDVSERKFHLEQLQFRNQELKTLKHELEQLVQNRTIELQKTKEKLEEIAFLDPLTNMPNRRFFEQQVERLISISNRRQLSLVFGVLDIDDFKLINDRYGHDVGDQVLIALANNVKKLFRVDEAYCRYGGEEFAFALAIEKESDLGSFIARIMEGIRNSQISHEENTISITASIGIYICEKNKDIDLKIEMKHADNALYQSKQTGKNKVTIKR